jgi:hypothetical protein
MKLPASRLFLSFAALVLFAASAAAQVPKAGDFYVDKGDLGFKIRTPAKWNLVPPQPGEETLIASFVPDGQKYMELTPQKPLFMTCWLVKFDRRKQPEAAEAAPEKGKPVVRRAQKAPPKDIEAWIKSNIEGAKAIKLDSQKDFTVQKIAATEYQFSTPDDPKERVSYYAAVYKLNPEVEVAIVFNGEGDPKKWHKWETPFTQMARSFAPVATKEIAGATATGTTLRDKVRAEQIKKLATLGGDWKLYETPNYFVLSDHKDKAFIEELKQRLERIREIYEQDYPAAKAEEFRKAGASAKTGDQKTDEEKAEEDFEKAMAEALNDGQDPKELAKCSVVRVLTDQAMYHAYGGPPGSAGYWSAYHRELVVFDDQASGGRGDTWATLNHEAFHQYIFYFYGSISPHSWYNEGTGDFYSGYQWKTNRFVLEKFQWRVGTIKEAVSEGKHVPLDQFVRYTQAEYYGNNKLGIDGGQNYAQGWSFIYFLRTGKKNNAKGWNPAWDNILETYLRVLAMSNKLDQAVDEAFKGIDMAALEKAWIDYTK